jgi:hypothetical protein
MHSTLEINPETAAKLQSLAKAKNVSIDDLLMTWIPGLQQPAATSVPADKAVQALEAWIATFPDTPPLSDEAIGRCSIYEGR